MTKPDDFDFDVFEKAVEIVALNLAFFRDDGLSLPTDNERLTAGHLVGGLAANRLLVTKLPDPKNG